MEELNEKIKGLVKKAEKSGMPYSILKKVYDRGMAAWKTGHRPGTTPQQWAFARVNSFVTKSSGTWGKADKDLADKVRGAKKESIQNPRKAKDIIGQVREKLGKDADAGDYIKDFRKSDAPQFKGKSDKKIRDMAIAAYLDSKDKKESVEEQEMKCPPATQDIKLNVKNRDATIKDHNYGPLNVDEPGDYWEKIADYWNTTEEAAKKSTCGVCVAFDISPRMDKCMPGETSDDDGRLGYCWMHHFKCHSARSCHTWAKGGPITKDEKSYNWQERAGMNEEVDIQEQIKTFNTNSLTTSDQLKLAIHFDKLSKDRQVPPENQKAYTAVSDYIRTKIGKRNFDNVMKKTSAMHKQDIEIEMSRIIGKSKTKKVIESKDNIQESGHQDVPSMKTQVQIALDALQKMNTELGKLSDEDQLPTWWTNKVAKAVDKLDGMADYIDAMHDRGQKMSESNLQEQKVFVFRYEYKGKRYAAPFKSEKDAKSSMKAAMKDKNVKNPSITQDILKRGVKFAEDVEIVEFIDEAVLAGRDYKYDGIGPIKISKKMYAKVQRDSKGKDFSGKPYMMALNPKTQETELVPVKFEEVDMQEASEFEIQVFMLGKILSQHPKFTDEMYDNFMDYAMDGDEFAVALKKSVPRQLYNVIKNHLDKKLKVSQFLSMSNDITEEEKKCPRCGTMNKVPFDKCSNCGLPHDEFATYKAEEVDNSLMAQATRVISKTSIKEKIDPADIDIRATDADRKAADKNIIIQLRRAQDMVKQTGRQDQTGIEFLDRKKQKVDSKIINKALDMFDKMKPNDKAKMQKTIGKSYRDLLKTVQRGRV